MSFKQNSPKDYVVKEDEKSFVHLEIQKQEFDPKTGKALFKSHPVIYTDREYKNFLKNKSGFTIVNYLHLPEGLAKEDGEVSEKAKETDPKKMGKKDLKEYAASIGIDTEIFKNMPDILAEIERLETGEEES